ncbi:MFS transporter [Nocardia callitridis]|uniref:MHS family MFS transporter n=1 Tax=Nocardia callitridis TaxID=648753 RepID=A0ABP9KQH2_9NOCA
MNIHAANTTTASLPTAPMSMRKVAIASSLGTTIEYYDFFIYATAAALVFPEVFFPALGPVGGTVASFATLSIAFVARPLGSIVFGHFGDRIGRKRSLVMTLLIMGIGTVLIGLLPGSDSIGVAAPIILVILRAAQGFAVGGEWAGATLLTAEHSPIGKRGRYAVYPQLGAPLGYLFSAGAFLIVSTVFAGNDTFLDWGWRIPFVASLALIVLGLWVRLTVAETPAFTHAQAVAAEDGEKRTAPFLQVIRHQSREVLLAAGGITMQYSFFYIGTAYLTSYATSESGMGLSMNTVLVAGVIASLILACTVIVAGRLSDRFGRRNTITVACVSGVVVAFALFPFLDLGGAFVFFLGLTAVLIVFGINFAPVGAFLPELFETRSRYTGAGLAFALGGVIGGGVVPLLAPALDARWGGIAVGGMLVVTALFSLVCIRLLPETKNRDVISGAPHSAATEQAAVDVAAATPAVIRAVGEEH